MALSMLIGETHLTGEQYTHSRQRKHLKSYMIGGRFDAANKEYILHVQEYDTRTTPKGDRYFDIVLSDEQLHAFLQILKLQTI